MKTRALLAIGLSVATSLVLADTPPAAPKKVVKLETLTCEDFITYDDVTRPQLVFWTEGATKKGKPGEEIIDMDRTHDLVPIVVDECTRTPKASFVKKEQEVSKKTITPTQAK